MGFVLSKFRKEKSTTVVLEQLQKQIEELEKYMINTQERKRRYLTNFLGITIGLCILSFALWYFFYFPPTLRERIMNLGPLLIFPVLIILVRQMFTWYFQRKLNKNGEKLIELKEKKNTILEQVMDKETYKVALNLLERFGDKKNSRTTMIMSTGRSQSSATSRSPAITQHVSTAPSTPAASQARSLTPYTGVYRNLNNNLNSTGASPISFASSSPQIRAVQGLRRRTPFPIEDERSRTALDRIVDFIVGDSPHNRFGMICKECHAHNGMLPKEDYEYTTFRCAFCDALNPARKERPIAPRLSLEVAQDSSGSDSSDDEERPQQREDSPSHTINEELQTTDTATASTAESHEPETEATTTDTIAPTEGDADGN